MLTSPLHQTPVSVITDIQLQLVNYNWKSAELMFTQLYNIDVVSDLVEASRG